MNELISEVSRVHSLFYVRLTLYWELSFDCFLALIGHRNGRISPIGRNSNADRSERREEHGSKRRCRSNLFSAKGR